ncbi:hypothetical protein V3C99_008171 [Haemonchus contortus]
MLLEGLFGQYRFADVPMLRAIFYAEFDIDIGPVIRYQIPVDQNVVSPKRFSAFSAAIIPKDEMLNRLVKLNLLDFKVMGHPIGLSAQALIEELKNISPIPHNIHEEAAETEPFYVVQALHDDRCFILG